MKASTWFYPNNVPSRQYQIDIVGTALFENTLVCLPTGLGKTLIAAVVMYNYYNWFPKGKIVFLAPTKPLVDQQKEACLYQVSMQQTDTAEMTGRLKPEMRQSLWHTKRVFFCTPQVFERDLLNGVMSPMEFVCVVVDECHKSTGNYATVKAIQFLKSHGVQFRVLGLSATPGRTKDSIQEMIENLMIHTVEFRDETDPEVCQHTHEKAVEAITVLPQPEMSACYQMLHTVMQAVLQPLFQAGVLYVNSVESVTRYGLLTSLQGFRGRSRQFRNASRLSTVFSQGIFLASLGENLDCGIRLALDFAQTTMTEKPFMREIPNRHPTFNQLTDRLQQLISSDYEHPKLQKLMEVLNHHFASADKSSRVIVFTSLRETVFDIVRTLERHRHPSISAKWFIGQGTGAASGKQKMSQTEQKRVLTEFRQGSFNVLVATCIAEEGLDIPEVQLIVCFDGAASPLRDTQRMGRTGRHGMGRVIYLLAEGKERRKYDRNGNETGYIKTLLRRAMFHFEMCEASPRMIPSEFDPEMVMMHMETTHPKDQARPSKKREAGALSDVGPKQSTLDAFATAKQLSSTTRPAKALKANPPQQEACKRASEPWVTVETEKEVTAVERTPSASLAPVQPPSQTQGSTGGMAFAGAVNPNQGWKNKMSPVKKKPVMQSLSSIKQPPSSTPVASEMKTTCAITDPTKQLHEGFATSCAISDITRVVFLGQAPLPENSSSQPHKTPSEKAIKREASHEASTKRTTIDSASVDSQSLGPLTRGAQNKSKVLCDDSTVKKTTDQSDATVSVSADEPSDRKAAERQQGAAFLDLDAEVTGSEGQSSDEDDEEEMLNELELFIDDSDSLPRDSVNMMAIYNRPLSSTTSTTGSSVRERLTRAITPGRTPFSQQSNYESSFVTSGSEGFISGSKGESTVKKTAGPRRKLCQMCGKSGKFIPCHQCGTLHHLACISYSTSLSGEWMCDACQSDGPCIDLTH